MATYMPSNSFIYMSEFANKSEVWTHLTYLREMGFLIMADYSSDQELKVENEVWKDPDQPIHMMVLTGQNQVMISTAVKRLVVGDPLKITKQVVSSNYSKFLKEKETNGS